MMNTENLKPVGNGFYMDERLINVEASISGLAKLKKLKTSAKKIEKLEKFGKREVDTQVEEKPIVVETPPLVLEPIKAEEMVKPAEPEKVTEQVIETPVVKQEVVEPVATEVSLWDTKNYGILPNEQVEKPPVYSFEPKVEIYTPAYAEQKTPMVSNGLLNIKSTDDLKRDYERAEGPVEKQKLDEIIKESEAKDLEKKQKEEELQEILRQEEEIKKAKEQKQREVRDCVEDRKKVSQEWAQTIAGAKKVDLYDKTLRAEEEKGLAELEAKKAQLLEKQERLRAEREKVVSDYKLDLTPEEEQTATSIEKNKEVNLDLSSVYERLSGVQEDIKDIGNDIPSYDEEETTKIYGNVR